MRDGFFDFAILRTYLEHGEEENVDERVLRALTSRFRSKKKAWRAMENLVGTGFLICSGSLVVPTTRLMISEKGKDLIDSIDNPEPIPFKDPSEFESVH